MTNNEAIGILAIVVETAKGRCFVTDEAISDSYAMAIKALEAQELSNNSPKLDKENGDLQQTCNQLATDCISRQKAIDVLCSVCQGRCIPCESYPCSEVEAINALPSAHTEIEERKEESAQNVPKEDLISRKAAIDALVKAIRKDPYYDSNEAINGLGVCDVRVILNDLPSAQPERKKGKWTVKKGELLFLDECSVCRKIVIHRAPHYNFCPNCGADMRGDNDDKSK